MKITLVRPEYSKIYGKFSLGKEVTTGEPPPLGLCYIAAIRRKRENGVSSLKTIRRGMTKLCAWTDGFITLRCIIEE